MFARRVLKIHSKTKKTTKQKKKIKLSIIKYAAINGGKLLLLLL